METKQPHLAQAAVDAALCADPEAVIRQADAAFDERLTAIADDIRENREKRPIVLLSGPSGSGKTTTARKLVISWTTAAWKRTRCRWTTISGR